MISPLAAQTLLHYYTNIIIHYCNISCNSSKLSRTERPDLPILKCRPTVGPLSPLANALWTKSGYIKLLPVVTSRFFPGADVPIGD